MGSELLQYVIGLLQAAGIPAGEEYPGFGRPDLEGPWAAVGLRELRAGEGTAVFRVRVLSPRILGGWSCQGRAANAVRALTEAGLRCAGEEMEYLSGSDCFSVSMTAVMDVTASETGYVPGARWSIACGEVILAGVETFSAVQDQQRRLVGAHWEREPVTVTPGWGGWKLELVQRIDGEPEELGEPFTLTVRENGWAHRYTGCCWNETRCDYTQGGLRLTRRGFALGREVEENG